MVANNVISYVPPVLTIKEKVGCPKVPTVRPTAYTLEPVFIQLQRITEVITLNTTGLKIPRRCVTIVREYQISHRVTLQPAELHAIPVTVSE